MRYAITVDIPDELLDAVRGITRLASAPVPARPEPPPDRSVRPHREPDPDDEPADVQSDAPAMDGPAFFRWLSDHRDRGVLRRAQDRGKKRGYTWKVSDWDADQVKKVLEELTAPGWGGKAAAQ